MGNMEKHSVDGLSIDCGSLMISLKRVPFGAYVMIRLLDDLAEADISVDVISRTAPVGDTYDVSIILSEDDLPKTREIINQLGDKFKDISIQLNKNITRFSLHGIGMRTQSGVAAKYFQVFADNDIPVLMVTTSEICISCIIRNEDAKTAAAAIREAFHLDEE